MFRAPSKIVTDHKSFLSCLSEEKCSKTTQTRLTRWVDRLLPFVYELEHIPAKIMGLVDFISRHPVGRAATVSELHNTFVVAQLREINRLIAPAASGCSLPKDVITETKTEQELRNRNECAAKKHFSAFKNCHLIKFCVTTERRTVKTSNFLIHLKWHIKRIPLNCITRVTELGKSVR